MTASARDVEVPRDRMQRPLIVPVGGGEKKVAYQRVTTLAKMMDDQTNITKWTSRMVSIGLADRPDLLLSVSAHRDNKDELNDIAEKAKEAARAGAAATTGTALHKLSEAVDRGQKLPPLAPQHVADLEAYKQATSGLRPVEIEKFVVHDDLLAAGTTDRIYDIGGMRYIGDTKTGARLDYGIGSIAIQLAVYSRSKGYNPEDGSRHELAVNQDWGLIVHLPAGTGECTLYWVDLNAGWAGALVAAQVRDYRKLTMKKLTHKIEREQVAA